MADGYLEGAGLLARLFSGVPGFPEKKPPPPPKTKEEIRATLIAECPVDELRNQLYTHWDTQYAEILADFNASVASYVREDDFVAAKLIAHKAGVFLERRKEILDFINSDSTTKLLVKTWEQRVDQSLAGEDFPYPGLDVSGLVSPSEAVQAWPLLPRHRKPHRRDVHLRWRELHVVGGHSYAKIVRMHLAETGEKLTPNAIRLAIGRLPPIGGANI